MLLTLLQVLFSVIFTILLLLVEIMRVLAILLLISCVIIARDTNYLYLLSSLLTTTIVLVGFLTNFQI